MLVFIYNCLGIFQIYYHAKSEAPSLKIFGVMVILIFVIMFIIISTIRNNLNLTKVIVIICWYYLELLPCKILGSSFKKGRVMGILRKFLFDFHHQVNHHYHYHHHHHHQYHYQYQHHYHDHGSHFWVLSRFITMQKFGLLA